MKDELDDLDLKILGALQRHGRVSFKTLSKRLDVSDATIYNRVNKLVKKKWIKRFTIDINEKKFGYEIVVSMGFNVESRNYKRILETLMESKHLYEVWTTSGAHNITARSIFRNFAEINKFNIWVNSIPGINKFDFTIVTQESKTSPRIDMVKSQK